MSACLHDEMCTEEKCLCCDDCKPFRQKIGLNRHGRRQLASLERKENKNVDTPPQKE